MKHLRTWYVVTDGGRARFLQKREAQDAFDTHREFVSADIHSHTHELGAERPGRGHESATSAHHAVEPREESNNPTLPKIADDHRCAARSLRRHVQGARRERLRYHFSYTTPWDTT